MRAIRTMVVAGATVLASIVALQPAAAGGSPGRTVACGGLVAYNEIHGSLDTSRLMAIPAAGGTSRVVWDQQGQGELDPAWSPDGRSIAFAGRTPPVTSSDGLLVADTRLYVLRPGASKPQVFIEQLGQQGGLRSPAWSPDGNRIAYLTGVYPPGAAYKGLAWVHIVDLRTGVDRLLTGVPGTLVTPDLAWSPRGDELLISALKPNTGDWTIFSARPDPAEPDLVPLISNDPDAKATVLAPAATGYPAYFPGGRAVLVEQDATDSLTSRLYVTDPGFRHLAPVTPIEGWETQPDFGLSPLQAVHQQYNNDRSSVSIAVLTLPTGRSRTLVPAVVGVNVERPDWQPFVGCRPWPFAT